MTGGSWPFYRSLRAEAEHSQTSGQSLSGRASSTQFDALLAGKRLVRPVALSAEKVLFGEQPQTPLLYIVELCTVPGITYTPDVLDLMADTAERHTLHVIDAVFALDTKSGRIYCCCNCEAMSASSAADQVMSWFKRILDSAGIHPEGAIGILDSVRPVDVLDDEDASWDD